MDAIKRIYRAILRRKKPLAYARRIGVNMAGGGYTFMDKLNGVQNPG